MNFFDSKEAAFSKFKLININRLAGWQGDLRNVPAGIKSHQFKLPGTGFHVTFVGFPFSSDPFMNFIHPRLTKMLSQTLFYEKYFTNIRLELFNNL